MQLPPLSGVPSYTDEHANPRNFTVAKLLHALEYLRCCNLSAEEEAAHRHQHDCEMIRMAAPRFSLGPCWSSIHSPSLFVILEIGFLALREARVARASIELPVTGYT